MAGYPCIESVEKEKAVHHQADHELANKGKQRRHFFRASIAFLGVSVLHASGATTPKETGLSFEGLLKDKPGFQPRRPAPLPVKEIPDFLSSQQLRGHYKVYRDVFEELLTAEQALRVASRDAAHAEAYAVLRERQVRAANAVLLHELYFRNLAVHPVEPPRFVLANISEHMGTMATWREDFRAGARVAGEWVTLVYDPYDDRWHNLPLADSNAGVMIGTNPLVVCDVAEHAWSHDYGDRESYIERFLEHVDWTTVAKRYRAVDRH